MKKLINLAFVIFVSGSVLAQVNPNVDQGLKPFGSFQSGNVDTVNLQNGNLMLHIPLLSYPQRGNHSFGFYIRYNNKSYTQKVTHVTGGVQYSQWYWSGTGVEIGFSEGMAVKNQRVVMTDQTGSQIPANYETVFTSDGSAHQLSYADGSNQSHTLDVSGISTSGGGYADRNGLTRIFGTGTMTILDPNGNQVTVGSSGWVDTVGRTIPGTNTATETVPQYGNPNTDGAYVGVPTSDFSRCPFGAVAARAWNVPAFGGTTATYMLCYQSYNYSTSFGFQNTTEASGTATLLQAIVLPDSTYWYFDYNNYLDLVTLQFPTGGRITYTWTTLGAWNSMSRAVTSRTLDSNDGTGGHGWNYSYTLNGNITGANVTDPLGNVTVHNFTAPCGGSDYETSTLFYNGAISSSNLIKEVDTSYGCSSNPFDELSQPPGPTSINAVATNVETKWANGKTTQTSRTYDSGVAWDYYDPVTQVTTAYQAVMGNVVNEKEYAFGNNVPGSLVRQIARAFVWQGNSSYKSANLIDLPQTVSIQDPSGNRCSETDYSYDEGSVSGVANPQGSGLTSSNQLVAPPAGIRGNTTSVIRWLASMSPSSSSCSASSGWNTFQSHTVFYDTGMPFETIDPLSHATTFAYSGTFWGAYVTQTTMPSTSSPNAASHVISGSYDWDTGLLSSFTDQNNQTSNYSYDSMFRITQVLMPADPNNGNMRPEVDFYYPDANDVERKQKIDGSRWTDMYVKFDGLGRESRRATFNDQPGGNFDQTDTCYDADGGVAYVSYAYQNTGFNFSNPCTAPIEPGDRTAYDGLGRVRTVTHSDNSVITTNYSGPSTEVIDEGNGSYNVTRTSQQDSLGRLISVCEVSSSSLVGSGGTAGVCVDDFGQTGFSTSYNYDLLGNLITVQQSGLSDRSFAYDSLSRLTSATNPESGTAGYSYDNDGELITRTRPQPNQVNSGVILTTSYTYDQLHRKRSVSYSNDPTGTPGSTFNYDETVGWGNSAILNTNGRLSTEYAGAGVGIAASMFSYDAEGRVFQNWQCTPRTCGTSSYYLPYGYDLLGDMISSQNGVGVSFGYSYNAAGRLMVMTTNYSNSPSTLLSNASYSPFGVAALTLGNGVSESLTYHQRGWLQGETDTAPTSTATGSVTISGSEQNAQVQTSAGAQSSVAITINGSEQSVCTDYIGSRCGVWAYDIGTVTLTVNGCTTSANYNRASTGSTIASDLAAGFSCGTVTASTSGAVITFRSVAYSSGTNSYTFSSSAVSTEGGDFAGASFFPSPASGNMTGGSDPTYTTAYDTGTANVVVNGCTKSYNWGQNDSANSIAANLASQFHNDPNCWADASSSGATVYLTSRTAGTGGNYSLSATMSHTPTGSFPNSSFSESASGSSLGGGNNAAPLYQYSLGFAPDGNVQSASDNVNGNWAYTYDQFNRLLTSNKNSGQQAFTYGYDRFGNRWSQTVTAGAGPQPSFSFTAGNNRLDGFSYDALGNVLNDGSHSYTYDAENRIIKVDGGSTATYVYDAEGRRVKSQNYEHLYDLGSHSITLLNTSDGGWAYGEVYATGRHIATYSGGTTNFAHLDWLGTERARSSMTGTTSETCTSLPFGDAMNCSATWSFRHLTGKEHDSESNLEYFGARYLSTAQGRFLSTDGAPIRIPDPQSLNRYIYSRDNPVSYVDIDGNLYTKIHGDITMDVLMTTNYNFNYGAASRIAFYDMQVDDLYNDKAHAYMHSQDGAKKPNRDAAVNKTLQFVRNSIQGAAAAILGGDMETAYKLTGYALHARQDEKHNYQPFKLHKGSLSDIFNKEGRSQDASDLNPSDEIIQKATEATENVMNRIFAAVEAQGEQQGLSEGEIQERLYEYRNGLSGESNHCGGAIVCSGYPPPFQSQ